MHAIWRPSQSALDCVKLNKATVLIELVMQSSQSECSGKSSVYDTEEEEEVVSTCSSLEGSMDGCKFLGWSLFDFCCCAIVIAIMLTLKEW